MKTSSVKNNQLFFYKPTRFLQEISIPGVILASANAISLTSAMLTEAGLESPLNNTATPSMSTNITLIPIHQDPGNRYDLLEDLFMMLCAGGILIYLAWLCSKDNFCPEPGELISINRPRNPYGTFFDQDSTTGFERDHSTSVSDYQII